MSELFFAADHHFDHESVIKFTDENGKKYRDFPDLDTMHQHIIAQHNSVVGVNDTVYFLGDVSFSGPGLEYLNEMNGKKFVLLKGNHDRFKITEYLKYFDDICGVLKKGDAVLSHVPVHSSQLEYRWKLNIHGHTHSNYVLDEHGQRDMRYYNVSMEAINFTPVSLDEILSTLK